MFKKVAVFGLGLLGGSICRRLKIIDSDIRISAYGRSPEKLEPARKAGFVDDIGSFDRISLAGVDLAVVATPVDSSIEIIRQLLMHPELGPNTLVMDVGSVKERIIRSVEDLDRAGQFIGCHPMAGSEKMGFEYSHADLFDGASVIITPHSRNRDADIATARRFWESLKARTVTVSPEVHDIIVTYTSHLPHMTASALVRVFHDFRRDRGDSSDFGAFIGRGFQDTTRIASGSPDMWRDIASMNRENVLNAIDMMIDELGRLRRIISDADADTKSLHEYFCGVKNIRDKLK